MTDGRIILDTDFTALPNALYWPHPDFKVVSAAYGALPSVTNGWGLLDTGNNGSYGNGIILRMRPQAVDKFEISWRYKIVTSGSGSDCWLEMTYRSTQDWNYTDGTGSGDTVSEVANRMSVMANWNYYKYQRRLGYGTADLPFTQVTTSWAAGTILRARMRVVGDTHAFKLWPDATPEPQAWSLRVVNTEVPRLGYPALGLFSQNAHGQMLFSRITIREIGNIWDPILSNWATATFSGTGSQPSFTVPHGLDGTPSQVLITPKSSVASAAHYVSAMTATTFTVTYAANPGAGTNNIVFDWRAEV